MNAFPLPATARSYIYAGDEPMYETDSSWLIDRSSIAGPAGTLVVYGGRPEATSAVEFSYYNAHGSLAASADVVGNRLAAYTYDAFGVADQVAQGDTTVQRWTGRWEKKTDTRSRLILMGASTPTHTPAKTHATRTTSRARSVARAAGSAARSDSSAGAISLEPSTMPGEARVEELR